MSNSRSKKRQQQQQRPRTASSGPQTPKSGAHQRGAQDGEITIFLSYARVDDKVYGMVRPFKEQLAHFIYAKSGRKVRTFLDQQDIKWGDIWKNELETSILGASVFIPMLSAAYLDSDNCRMEFNRFQNNATALGVRELLLPVLLLDAPAIFNEFSDDDIVIESAARQWEVIEDAVLSDVGTSDWKKTMSRLADRFVISYAAAEARLAELESDEVGSAASLGYSESEDDDSDADGAAPGLAELMETIQAGLEEVTADAQILGPAIVDLGTAAAENKAVNISTPQQLQAWSRAAAEAFQEPAERLAEGGERMFATAKRLDVDFRRLRVIGLELLPVSPDVAKSYNEMVSQISLSEVRGQLETLLDQMKPAEALSVPLRQALRPARLGLTRVTDSLQILGALPPIDID